jgi:hypothetical protein
MLTHLLVTLILAAPIDADVLVLTNGNTMDIQRFELLEGGKVEAVTACGTRLRFKAGKVALAATYRANGIKAAPGAAHKPRPPQSRLGAPDGLLAASRKAKAEGKTGGMSVTTGPGYVPPKREAAPYRAAAASPGQDTTGKAILRGQRIEMQRKLATLEGSARSLRAQIELEQKTVKLMGPLSRMGARANYNIGQIREELDPIEAEIAATKRALRQLRN